MPKRKKKESVEQINYATVAKPHTSMYLMHKYWARKPHNVVSEYIENYTKEGDIVLDPMCGSGTTCLVAKKLGRNYIGIDISKEYCTVAENRIKEASANKSLFQLIGQQQYQH